MQRVGAILPNFGAQQSEPPKEAWESSDLPGFGAPENAFLPAEQHPSGFGSINVPGDSAGGVPLGAGAILAPNRQGQADFSGNTPLFYPGRSTGDPVLISAKQGRMRRLSQYDLYFLEGDCDIRQGDDIAKGPMAVVWVARARTGDRQAGNQPSQKVIVYLESADAGDPVRIAFGRGPGATRINDWQWQGEFSTVASVNKFIPILDTERSGMPDIYGRAIESMGSKKGTIRQVQFLSEIGGTPKSTVPEKPTGRRIGIYSRSDQLPDTQTVQDPNNPARSLYVITNGINLTIEGVNGNMPALQGKVQDISADYAVIWAKNLGTIERGKETLQDENDDFEVYLAGNIVFRDGDRTIFADRLYYDVKNKLAYILDGEIIAPVPGTAKMGIKGLIRMKAEILRQQGDGLFEAENAMITSSMLGKPSYKLRAKTMTLNQTSTPLYNTFTGAPIIDPETGRQEVEPKMWLVSENNFIDSGDIPVFYWPWMAANVQDPILYIRSFGYGNDTIMGNQFRTGWNPYQILNIRKPPEGTSWDVNVDYFDKRGLALGTSFAYDRPGCLGIPGKTRGAIHFWGLDDEGYDNLGRRRNHIKPMESYRYRFLWTHTQELGTGLDPWVLSAQVGKTSDRNFMEQYYDSTWFTAPNETTALSLRKTEDNRTLELSTEYSLNPWVTNTNTLPRLDHYILGQSLLNDTFTWHGHTRVEYAQYVIADPTDPQYGRDPFQYLEQEKITDSSGNPVSRAEGEVFSTRHELDLPFSLGPVRCVPYVLGDFSHWGKDRSGQSLDRLYGQAGVRFNLPLWKVNPNVSSKTWYVNGLAHKVDFDAEFLHASADQSIDNLILYDPLDDWSTDAARRRYAAAATFNKYGVPIYDARYYALRSGIAGNVSSPVMEIADSLTMLRVGMTHRWQTKRGAAGRRNIIDWITFSTHFNYYPKEMSYYKDTIGLIDYDFNWHIGDRVTLFSSGLFDAGQESQQMVQLGISTIRPGRGSLSMAVDWLEGCISRTYLSFNASYTMSEKYAMAYTTAYDLTAERNVGHNFVFIRTGESFRILLGANYNESLENWGFTFGIEPNFFPRLAGIMQRGVNQAKQGSGMR